MKALISLGVLFCLLGFTLAQAPAPAPAGTPPKKPETEEKKVQESSPPIELYVPDGQL
ncbi:hypothetical protein [Prosthecobacter sp.]|uniref:hypothetical protein n=1 Tax=Prosthecobacter sp. TaxID=1965333 RepID=UPI00378519D1